MTILASVISLLIASFINLELLSGKDFYMNNVQIDKSKDDFLSFSK